MDINSLLIIVGIPLLIGALLIFMAWFLTSGKKKELDKMSCPQCGHSFIYVAQCPKCEHRFKYVDSEKN